MFKSKKSAAARTMITLAPMNGIPAESGIPRKAWKHAVIRAQRHRGEMRLRHLARSRSPGDYSNYACLPWPREGVTPPMHYPHRVTGEHLNKT